MKIYFDSCAFIRGIEGSDDISRRLLKILYLPLNLEDLAVLTSVITYTEVRTGALIRLDEDPTDPQALKLVEIYSFLMVPYFFAGASFLNDLSPIDCTDVTIDIASRAAELRSNNAGLKTPDALHLATATESRCDVFVSDDRPTRRIATELGLRGASFSAQDLDILLASIDVVP